MFFFFNNKSNKRKHFLFCFRCYSKIKVVKEKTNFIYKSVKLKEEKKIKKKKVKCQKNS
jgi:hypothetical protein